MKARIPFAATRFACGLFLLATASYAMADTVYVTACIPGTSTTQDDGTYFDFTSPGATGIAGNAPGSPARTHSKYFSSGFTNNVGEGIWGVQLNPGLGVAGGLYQIDHNFNSGAGNVSADITLTATCSIGGTLSFTTTGTNFTAPAGSPGNKWQLLGYLTNSPGSAAPTIEFGYLSGSVDAGTDQRLLVDCFRFTLVEDCLSVSDPLVQGPLATNLPTVRVGSVVSNATAVTVYQDSGGGMVQIGELTSGITGGVEAVPVSGLVKGAVVSATQTVGGQESCVQNSGLFVGGGANPRIRVALSIRETSSTGPIGTPGTLGSGNLHFLGSTFLTNGAPGDGVVISASNDWQTVLFPTNSPSIQWNGGTATNIGTPWGIVDAIAFAIDDLTDTGPYDLYIDNLQNGATVFQNWEAFCAGQQDAAFRSPGFSGSTSGKILSEPDLSAASNAAADAGTKSLRTQFQWVDTNPGRWLRFTTFGVGNPQIDLSEPISFRMLLLPVNADPVAPPPPSLDIELINGEVVINWEGSHALQAAADVTGTYTNVLGCGEGPYTNAPTESTRFFRLAN